MQEQQYISNTNGKHIGAVPHLIIIISRKVSPTIVSQFSCHAGCTIRIYMEPLVLLLCCVPLTFNT